MSRRVLHIVVHLPPGSGLSRSEVGRIVGELETCGLDVTTTGDAEGSCAAVLLADSWSSTLQEELARLSVRTEGRVVLVQAGRSPWPEAKLWDTLAIGAADVVTWKRGGESARHVCETIRRWHDIDELVDSPVVRNHLIGRSRCWITLLRHLIEVARFTPLPVLVLGESGTGKELAARLVHTLDSRRDKTDLVLVDCTTISPNLSGSEFFGHERGAFTGAYAARDGAFALANKGSLFLDEVGELPLLLQAELLRVIQEKTYKRVGSSQWQRTEFRLICATNRDLQADVAHGRFRSDLYYRLAGWTFTLPPLRDRRADILMLAEHFIREAVASDAPPAISPAVQNYLMNREYVGNVRELKLLVSRILSRHSGTGAITVGAIPPDERPGRDPVAESRDAGPDGKGMLSDAVQLALQYGWSLKEIGKAAEEIAVQRVLTEEGGNLKKAAQRLRVTARALQIRKAARRQNAAVPLDPAEGKETTRSAAKSRR